MRTVISWIAILANAMLVGCATFPSEPKKFETKYPNGVVTTMVGYNKIWPDYMYRVDTLKLGFAVKGQVTADHFRVVNLTEVTCRAWTEAVRPNKVLSLALDAGLGTIGGAGLGEAARSIDRTSPSQYLHYGATAGFIAGGIGGIKSLATQVDTMNACGQAGIGFIPEYGIRIVPTGLAY